jgi:dual specificity phosphatase 3
MNGSTKNVSDPAAWWRVLCFPVPNVVVSGDIDRTSDAAAERQLREWIDAGITDIIDARGECREGGGDKTLVERIAPGVNYHWVGTNDNGNGQSDEWFDIGVAIARKALTDQFRKVLFHCHMGVNRGPSMAYAVLLDLGYGPVAALDLIRTARPIAAMLYAEDALRWWHRRTGTPATQRAVDEAAVKAWFQDNECDVGWIVSRIRLAEWAA